MGSHCLMFSCRLAIKIFCLSNIFLYITKKTKGVIMTNPAPSPLQPEGPKEKESFQEKFQKSIKEMRSNEKFQNVVSFATSNTRDTVSYIVLIIGIVSLFFYPFYGGSLIGLIAGFYFSAEILSLLHHFNDFVDEQGIVKSLIGGGLLLGLFISAPAIFIGIALAVAIRQILFPNAKQ